MHYRLINLHSPIDFWSITNTFSLSPTSFVHQENLPRNGINDAHSLASVADFLLELGVQPDALDRVQPRVCVEVQGASLRANVARTLRFKDFDMGNESGCEVLLEVGSKQKTARTCSDDGDEDVGVICHELVAVVVMEVRCSLSFKWANSPDCVGRM